MPFNSSGTHGNAHSGSYQHTRKRRAFTLVIGKITSLHDRFFLTSLVQWETGRKTENPCWMSHYPGFQAGAQQRMRIGMSPRKAIQLVISWGTNARVHSTTFPTYRTDRKLHSGTLQTRGKKQIHTWPTEEPPSFFSPAHSAPIASCTRA